MDFLSIIKQPISNELAEFIGLFNSTLEHEYGLLQNVLDHIRQRGGKRMRPMLILLIAKNYGGVSDMTQRAAVGLELLHTASLVHDDVVDESNERRGQASVNATYNNKVAVLVGDFILSSALLRVAETDNELIIKKLARLGQTLSAGEVLQLTNIDNEDISEEVYYQVIRQKTAALFESCCEMGALSAGVGEEELAEAREFGRNIGLAFQIRDDIFDYYDSAEIGKPTGNDMAEGKLTLPVIYALNSTGNKEMLELAGKVKQHTVTTDEIGTLVAFTKENGGIEYAERKMEHFRNLAQQFIDRNVEKDDIKRALTAYIDFIVHRNK
ncbi:MAG: polyprenyl synthetase family protein [Prevotella sp.]|uniref:polyprenyl synthetase family protein n=1 Tax=Prevotella sp. TaxID=59823 RepID=UPI002A2AF4A2|nr:polyprenyl synthetase family protein [Prevotella sp.]MDD7318445.1 polyprenyl synthetase family protein [Prevotellaceae bacterium]MDY4020204.1 polyprenyl synthetase family protein [Prevotella sp.]